MPGCTNRQIIRCIIVPASLWVPPRAFFLDPRPVLYVLDTRPDILTEALTRLLFRRRQHNSAVRQMQWIRSCARDEQINRTG